MILFLIIAIMFLMHQRGGFICIFNECCTDFYIPFNTPLLQRELNEEVFGQPLISDIVHILEAHKLNVQQGTTSKALAISFHGWPGTGKNFVTGFIAKHLFREGTNSEYYKLYKGGEFLNPNKINEYQARIKSEINTLMQLCPRSMIVFDEVNTIQPGVFEIITNFIESHQARDSIDYSQAIFIFLSNIAGDEIMLHLSSLEKSRENLELADFDGVIRNASFRNGGGFEKAGLISHFLIDHYIPFLPLEQKHVIQCVKNEFASQGIRKPSYGLIEKVMAVVNYGPPNHPIYANAGCKRIKKQVSFIVNKYKDEL